MIYIKKLLKEIENVKIDKEINLEKYNHTSLVKVRFTQEGLISNDEDTKGKYSWVAYNNSYYSYSTVFPIRGQYVIFFKTLIGAKRNFIKSYIEGR